MTATSIIITEKTDSRAWDDALDAMVLRLQAATGDASVAAARLIKNTAQGYLDARSHGPYSFSPSPPGTAPARVSGRLSASIDVVRSGRSSAMVGPTGLPYARIQELGGEMHGHPYMRYFKNGRWHLSAYVQLPPRPYLKPATDAEVDSGAVMAEYELRWAEAIEGW